MPKCKVVAHRGSSHTAPENTLPAFKLAFEQHADYVELDIYLTTDKRIVAFHDRTTARISMGALDVKVCEATSEQMRSFDAGIHKDKRYAGEKVPFLEEVLDILPADVRLFVEIKSGCEILHVLRPLVEASGKLGQVEIITFTYDVACGAKAMWPGTPVHGLASPQKDPATGAVIAYDAKLIEMAKHGGLDGLDLEHSTLTKEYADSVLAAGLKLNVWTVDEPEEMVRCARMGVHGITSNRPDVLREVLQKEGL